MPRNEFGVESSKSSGFGFGVGDDFEDMFEDAMSRSVSDDEVAPTHRDEAPEAPARVEVEAEEDFADFDAPELEDTSSVAETATGEETTAVDSFDDIGNDFDGFGEETSQWDSYEDDSPVDGNLTETPEAEVEPEPEIVEEAPTPAPTPTPEPEPVPASVPAEPASKPASYQVSTPEPTEEAISYIEQVILTSDAIRQLPDGDEKAANIFITGGNPVESHQEFVLAALLADKQILRTTEAVLEAKEKNSVDRAFYILGLDEITFAELGDLISHDLDSKVTISFHKDYSGDRLAYARRLVDLLEELTAASVKRFEAVVAVLKAGEPQS